ncbi:MAG: cation transporter [Saccharofermentans sp.]|jgi:copper chaperone CopZ|nr:cation transporter [Mageeibacillus sp.]MCI1263989.1 cation transporter [Saccharofermentans sp.]MCI1274551.1 cation transporter [Saccharofermentans sp.]MCI1768934.1 cation transporter [Mageeibacillus sp.]MCI2043837.1 cation transporter [Mageeibacillus sp.]
MYRTVAVIEGMMCGMCEKHVTEAIKAAVKTISVDVSHKDGNAVILSDEEPDKALMEDSVVKAGYKFVSCKSDRI